MLCFQNVQKTAIRLKKLRMIISYKKVNAELNPANIPVSTAQGQTIVVFILLFSLFNSS